MINNVCYIEQKKNEESYIPGIIEVNYINSTDTATVRPFKVIYKGKEYDCDGLTSSVWHPMNNDLFYLNYNPNVDKFELWAGTIMLFQLFKEMPDKICCNDIGVVIWVENNTINVLKHV